MSRSESDYLPTDDEEEVEEINPLQTAAGGDSSDEGYSSSASSEGADEGGTFFDDELDPLAVLKGMETSDQAPYELLLQQRRRRSKRLARKDEEDEEEEEEEEYEEYEDEDEEGGEDGEEGGEGEAAADRGGPSNVASKRPRPRVQHADNVMGDDGDGIGGSEEVLDKWNDDLAERLGLAPSMSRRRARNREKYRRRANKTGIARRDLPEEVSKKLGEANLLYAMQRHQEAIAMLQEVVRLAPYASDAYHLLGLLYEEVGDAKRSLNFFMIAAHLTPKQADLWRRLADMSNKQGLVRQSVYCLTQVIKRDRDDVDARYDRSMLLASLGQHRKAVEGLEAVRAARPEHPEVAKQLARLYFHAKQSEKAAAVLRAYWDTYPETTDLTHVNLLAELLFAPDMREWQEALDVLNRARREMVGAGEEFPIELAVKAALATARLGDVDSALVALQPLMAHPVAMFDDLFFAVADAFEALGRDDSAEPFLKALADEPLTARPDVWRRLADCRARLHGPSAAVDLWRQVLEEIDASHFGHMDAVLALTEALREAGDEVGAGAALGRLGGTIPQGAIGGVVGLTTEEDLIQRAGVLKACGRDDLFVDLALPSVQASLAALEAGDTAAAIARRDAAALGDSKPRGRGRGRGRGRRSRGAVAQEDPEDAVFVGYVSDRRRRSSRRRQEDEEAPAEILEVPMPPVPTLPGLIKDDEPFKLMVDTVLGLLRTGRAPVARELAEHAATILNKRTSMRRKRDVMRLLAGEAALVAHDLPIAISHLKTPAARWPSSPAAWNAFARCQIAAGGARQTMKFMAPLRHRNPSSLPLMLMNGHAHLQSGAYSTALGEYFQAYRAAPDEPLVLLCLAVALANYATSRHVPNRNTTVLEAFALLQEYGRRRREPAEAAYNMARAAQQLTLNFLAVPLYQKALATAAGGTAAAVVAEGMEMMEVDGEEGVGPSAGSPTQQSQAAAAARDGSGSYQFEVAPEAAFNLALILKGSGAAPLARRVLREHLTF